jgi:parallel beta-helix repeat protein
VTRNTLIGGNGVIVDRSVRNNVSRNEIIATVSGAVMGSNATSSIPTQNTISRNRIVGGEGRGVDLVDAVANTITLNTIVGFGSSSGDGIRLITGGFLGGAQENSITKNVITGGSGSGISLGSDSSRNVITGNTVSANDEFGIQLLIDADGNVLSKNTVNENGIDGIEVFDPLNASELPDRLSRNTANRNGFFNNPAGVNGLGIDAGTDSIVSKNTASGNDNTMQCEPDPIC